MVKAKSKGYKLGVVNKQGMLFKDLCEMYFKRCEANGLSHSYLLSPLIDLDNPRTFS